MTKKRVKEIIKEMGILQLERERIIDIDIVNNLVFVITITEIRTFWRRVYTIENGELKLFELRMAKFD